MYILIKILFKKSVPADEPKGSPMISLLKKS